MSGKYHQNPELLQKKRSFLAQPDESGFGKSRPLVKALEEIGARYNATAAQVALNWVIHFHGETIVTIPGATRVSQAQESAGAMKFMLEADELARLDELTRKRSSVQETKRYSNAP